MTHTFAGGCLDRAAHLRSDAAAIAGLLETDGARFLPYRAASPLVTGGRSPGLGWLSAEDLAVVVVGPSEALFLGLEEGEARFAVPVPETVQEGDLGAGSSSFRGVREVAPLLSVADASVMATGRSLVAWHASHGYCPRCGSASSMIDAGHARRCTDSRCGVVQFPRTDPVVIMLIHRNGSCLLGRAVRSRRYPPGLHSCLAGYVEPGESIEEAVRRETLEEAGLRVGHVRYHSSQPWPFPSTLMIGCFAEALAGRPRIDPAELESVRWFTREELLEAVVRWDEDGALRVPPPLTIAHQLARAWLSEGSGLDTSHP
ncbi:MAG: NAD(+) diphosphatase [Gemmatimonadetes bacterium]|nr:NAD(+) diphosphatase [Gemmatimonadota bacterium]